MSKTFLYFAYGSNMLTQRILINNPTATREGIGKLEHYRLDFVTFSTRWKGAAATIVPTKDSHVWGSVWKIDLQNLPALDDQEGVRDKVYFPTEVVVEHPDGKVSRCRSYQQTNTPVIYDDIKNLPEVRRPSSAYLKVIQLGAKESGLPDDYIEFLQRIPDNGYTGNVDVKIDFEQNNTR